MFVPFRALIGIHPEFLIGNLSSLKYFSHQKGSVECNSISVSVVDSRNVVGHVPFSRAFDRALFL